MLLNLLFSDPLLFLIILSAIALALAVHEYFHAFSAYLLGDDTAYRMGRLTINPLAHFDILGLLCLLFFGFGWGKPVPFNPLNLKNPKRDSAIIAFSGPFSNFLMVLIFTLLFRLFSFQGGFAQFAGIFIWLNLLWGSFNLIPIPPLDGSHILFALKSFKEEQKIFLFQYHFFFLLGAIFLMHYLIIPYLLEPIFSFLIGPSFL